MDIINAEIHVSNSAALNRIEEARKEAASRGDLPRYHSLLAIEVFLLRQALGAATPTLLLPEAANEYHGLLSVSRTG